MGRPNYGVRFGGPDEFRFQGTFIGDYQPLVWNDSLVKHNMVYNAGLYDDLYMDLTFVDVFEKYGLDALVDSFNPQPSLTPALCQAVESSKILNDDEFLRRVV